MKHLFLVVVVVLTLVVGIGGAANAASSGSVSLTGVDLGSGSQQYVITTVPSDNDDNTGYDYLCVVTYNGNGEIFDIDVNSIPTGTTEVQVTNFTDPVGLGAYVEPLSVVLTDPNTAYLGNENTQAGADWCATFPPAGGSAPATAAVTAGCDTYMPLTSTSVVGAFVQETKLYWGPDMDQPTDSTVPAAGPSFSQTWPAPIS